MPQTSEWKEQILFKPLCGGDPFVCNSGLGVKVPKAIYIQKENIYTNTDRYKMLKMITHAKIIYQNADLRPDVQSAHNVAASSFLNGTICSLCTLQISILMPHVASCDKALKYFSKTELEN